MLPTLIRRASRCGVAAFAAVLLLAFQVVAGEPPRISVPSARIARAPALAPLGTRLARRWDRVGPQELLIVWVDLAPRGQAAGEPRPDLVTTRSLRRRSAALPGSPAVDASDLPLDPAALDAVRSRVGRVRERSRWLNSVSVEATRAQLEAVRALPGVRGLELVATTRRRPPDACEPRRVPPEERRPRPAQSVPAPRPLPAGPGYGQSAQQLHLIHADALHDRGLYGLGVLVAHFDTGYRRPSHEVFRTLRIAAMHDFVDGDANPFDADNPGDALDHGQYTLSVLGGFKPGKLVGVAPGATFLLARTESSAVESAAEEDYWIAALEWADSLGADIVSSSLKFLAYDDGSGYTWENMDGLTARVTIATDRAERLGILVVNGAGNEGFDPYHNSLVAPADGRYVLAAGAVTMAGRRCDFSSNGPTTDYPPRIKPDLMAPGENVVAADVLHDSSYTRVSGTSLSTPLIAGVAALLLSVHDATPGQMRDALRRTASNAASPDNFMGWGIVDALAAYQYLVGLFPTDSGLPVVATPALRFANPFPAASPIAFALPAAAAVTLRVYDCMGRQVRVLLRDTPAAAGERRIFWDGTDDGGGAVPSGVYFVELQSLTSRVGAAGATAAKLTLIRR
jgi:subtilisin family serine protease